MGRLYLCLSLVFFAHASYAIHFFEGTYQQALNLSETQHKSVLLYFTAKWCGPCHYMERNVLNSDSITTLTDQQFITLKIDYDAWSAKPLITKYKVGGLPTFIVINAQEVVQRQAVGALPIGPFFTFLTPSWQPSLKMATLTEEMQFRYVLKKEAYARWKVELGVQTGLNWMQVAPVAPTQKLGYELGLLMAFTKRRLSIRPGLSVVSIGGKFDDQQSLALQYVVLPVQLAYLLRKTALFSLPGGYRASLTPYMSKLINSANGSVNVWDYGSKLGISAFIGDTTQLEAQLGYQLGLHEVGRLANAGAYNRGTYLSITLIF